MNGTASVPRPRTPHEPPSVPSTAELEPLDDYLGEVARTGVRRHRRGTLPPHVERAMGLDPAELERRGIRRRVRKDEPSGELLRILNLHAELLRPPGKAGVVGMVDKVLRADPADREDLLYWLATRLRVMRWGLYITDVDAEEMVRRTAAAAGLTASARDPMTYVRDVLRVAELRARAEAVHAYHRDPAYQERERQWSALEIGPWMPADRPGAAA